MEIQTKKFETEFSVQVTALINHVLNNFEEVEEMVKAQGRMIEQAGNELNACTEKLKEQTKLYNDLVIDSKDDKVEIQRLAKIVRDNNL